MASEVTIYTVGDPAVERTENRSLSWEFVLLVPCWVASGWLLKPVPLKPSSLTESMINLSIQNFIPLLVSSDLNPFLVPSDLNPLLTEIINQSQMTKIAVVNLNVLKMLL